MQLLTENSVRVLVGDFGQTLQEQSEYEFARCESSQDTEDLRRKVARLRLSAPSTKPWYNPQRFLRYFR